MRNFLKQLFKFLLLTVFIIIVISVTLDAHQVFGNKFEPIVQDKQILIVQNHLLHHVGVGDFVVFKSEPSYVNTLGVIVSRNSSSFTIVTRVFKTEYDDNWNIKLTIKRDIRMVEKSKITGKVIFPAIDTELILERYSNLLELSKD